MTPGNRAIFEIDAYFNDRAGNGRLAKIVPSTFAASMNFKIAKVRILVSVISLYSLVTSEIDSQIIQFREIVISVTVFADIPSRSIFQVDSQLMLRRNRRITINFVLRLSNFLLTY